jgi:hypothetical protein
MKCFAGPVASIAFVALAAGAAIAVEPASGSRPAALTALPQGTVAWATVENDLGEVEDSLPLSHLTVVLKRSPERQQAFEEFLRQQQDPASPNFHHWLTPVEVGERFGASAQSIDAVTSWLQAQGLQVDGVANSGVRIEFSGSAASVGGAFASRLHAFAVDGERLISPAGAPRIPTTLSEAVRSVHGLETLHERSDHRSSAVQTLMAPGEQQKVTSCSGGVCTHFIGPADFAAIYDVNSVYQQGIDGSGQTIAIIGRANVYLPDIENFQKLTGLAIKDPSPSFRRTASTRGLPSRPVAPRHWIRARLRWMSRAREAWPLAPRLILSSARAPRPSAGSRLQANTSSIRIRYPRRS